MNGERKRALGAALEAEQRVIRGRKQPHITEAYICLMQLLAVGRFNHEILENPQKVNVFVKKLQNSGVEFPNVNDWFVSSTQRRILSIIQSGVTDKHEIIQRLGLDIGLGTLGEHLRVMRSSGVELPDLKHASRRRLSQ